MKYVTLGLILLVIGGCVQPVGNPVTAWTPRAQLKAAKDTYSAVTNSLAGYVESGDIEQKEAQRMVWVAEQGDNLLDRWQALVDAGQLTPAAVIREFNAILIELRSLEIRAKRRANNGT